ncbi:MAG: hypothetical protein K2N22_05070 [Clostridia bacterium]|nr:hypothetical protein [Clostridia bacterium]
MKAKKLSKKITAFIVCAVIITVLLITAGGLQIGFVAADQISCWRPNYEMLSTAEMDAILDKESLTKEDYKILYAQTGLTEIGIDRALAKGAAGKNRIKSIQKDYFDEYEVDNQLFTIFTCTDYTDKQVTGIYLEEGDILVTSSTHISGVRIGHSGLVIDGNSQSVLEANAYGSKSRVYDAGDFYKRVNFMVLRVKDGSCDAETKSKVVDYAMENLNGIPYEGLAGLLTNKNKIKKTQCAHLIWYAYKQVAGIDLDGNGGIIVTPKNIAASKHVEVVQVFGFDPAKLWK